MIIPPVLNIIAMIKEVGIKTLEESISGTYERFGIPYNPWPELIPAFILICVLIGILAWSIVQIPALQIFRKRSQIVRYLLIIIISINLKPIIKINFIF